MTIGEKLVALRGDKKQKEVAESVGICTSTLSMYERDERVPRDEIKVRLAAFYGVSIAELFYASAVHET